MQRTRTTEMAALRLVVERVVGRERIAWIVIPGCQGRRFLG